MHPKWKHGKIITKLHPIAVIYVKSTNPSPPSFFLSSNPSSLVHERKKRKKMENIRSAIFVCLTFYLSSFFLSSFYLISRFLIMRILWFKVIEKFCRDSILFNLVLRNCDFGFLFFLCFLDFGFNWNIHQDLLLLPILRVFFAHPLHTQQCWISLQSLWSNQSIQHRASFSFHST